MEKEFQNRNSFSFLMKFSVENVILKKVYAKGREFC